MLQQAMTLPKSEAIQLLQQFMPIFLQREFVDSHVHIVFGIPTMTVCEYMKLRSIVPLSYDFSGVIIIGMLVETPKGKWLQQSCSESLRSGDYSWPNAIALEEAAEYTNLGYFSWEKDILPKLIRPSDEELDPRDREGHWAAFFGKLQTRNNLVVVPCDNGKQCAYGYGAISAPALLQYEHLYDFRKLR
jgi:hypothetical protein